jgi:hypothetical protein
LVLVGSKAGVHRDDPARDDTLALLATDGVEACWDRYWAPLFGPNAAPAVVERARALADGLASDLLARGVSAFYNRPDLSAFVCTWPKPRLAVSGA